MERNGGIEKGSSKKKNSKKKKVKTRSVIVVDKKRRGSGLGVIIFIVMLVCCFLFVKKMDLDQEKMEYARILEVKQKELKELEKESKSIEEYKTYVKTKSYVEKVAREKLGLVYEDEIIFESED